MSSACNPGVLRLRRVLTHPYRSRRSRGRVRGRILPRQAPKQHSSKPRGHIRIRFLSEGIAFALTGGAAGVAIGPFATTIYAPEPRTGHRHSLQGRGRRARPQGAGVLTVRDEMIT
jgi:hypothetical protein